MVRIQNYIVGLKKHDRKLRKEEEQKIDPFAKRGAKRWAAPEAMRYADPEPKEVMFEGRGRHGYAVKLRNFISKIEWKTE